MSIARFLSIFSLIVLVTAGIAYANPGVLIPKFWLMFGFLAVITAIAYILAYLGLKRGRDLSVYIVQGSVLLKLLLSLVFVAIYLKKIHVNSTVFQVEFFSIYLLFTVFEIYALLRNLRHQNKT